MNSVEVILAALAAGAGAGANETAKAAVMDAYTGLVDVLRRSLAGRPRAQEVLRSEQTEPGMWRAQLAEELADSGADRDVQVLVAARRLLELVDPEGLRSGKYTVDLSSTQGIRVGDGTLNVNNSYGPTAATMAGPVTVNYGQLPVPPARPEA